MQEKNSSTKQNDVLSDEVNDLQSVADRMKLQGIGDNEMEELLNENKEINKELMKILKSRIVEKIVSLVLDIEYVDSNYTMIFRSKFWLLKVSQTTILHKIPF